MAKIAVISAIIDQPQKSQSAFNQVVSSFGGMVRGRLGVPFPEHGLGVVSLTVTGELDDINSLTGRLGKLEGVLVKTAISKKEI